MRFYFLNTCYASPEQYDVYRANGELCGYVRLRWGSLRADYPNIDGDTIYQHEFEDNYKGCFDSDDERAKYLTEICNSYKRAILKNTPTKLSENEVYYEILTDIKDLEERLKYV